MSTRARRALVLLGAGLAFMAGQGFARFGLTLILPAMRTGLGLSLADVGLIAGAAFVAYVLCAAPAGLAAARFGPRRVVSLGLLLSSAGLALTGLTPSFELALAAQALNGAAGAGIIVPLLGLAPSWFERPHWARATGSIVAGGGLGLIATGLLVPWILQAGADNGWRLAWLALAGATLLIAVLAFTLLREPAAGVRRQVAADPDDEPAPSAYACRLPPAAPPVYRSVAVWKLGLAFGCYGLSYAVYGTFFGAQLADQRRVDTEIVGRLWSLVGLAAIGSGLLGGWLADRFGRAGPLALLFLAQGLATAGLALGTGQSWYFASALLYGLTVWGFPAVITAATSDIVGPDLTPAAVGLTVLCFGLGQALGPPLTGVLAELTGSLSIALLCGAAADALGLAVAATGVGKTSPLHLGEG